jgi:hypothetical protein
MNIFLLEKLIEILNNSQTRMSFILQETQILTLHLGQVFISEYCGQNEPVVRSFDPPFADNRASECG